MRPFTQNRNSQLRAPPFHSSGQSAIVRLRVHFESPREVVVTVRAMLLHELVPHPFPYLHHLRPTQFQPRLFPPIQWSHVHPYATFTKQPIQHREEPRHVERGVDEEAGDDGVKASVVRAPGAVHFHEVPRDQRDRGPRAVLWLCTHAVVSARLDVASRQGAIAATGKHFPRRGRRHLDLQILLLVVPILGEDMRQRVNRRTSGRRPVENVVGEREE
mmetsp:Transcript_88311/g.248692  ORF Transcript_88311/g.248692 Transcript_88311/m.248692 type:complete len:217 (-) Transcript_88311:694-1344(-)